jgi:2-polyprenyl-3-methyl-5-hydroxy-6-metoxy-1,4-benzoquinol methylase
MPVDTNLPKEGMLYQRRQYAKGGLGAVYWDFRDRAAFASIQGDRIVDIGCGEGITLERLVRTFHGKNIEGIDTERENIEICRKQGLPVRYGSVFNLPFSESSIDCVLFLEVIEHLKEPRMALLEINRVLAPKGRLILIFPNDGIFRLARLLTGRLREAFYDAGHVMQWSPSRIRRVLKAGGFVPVSQRNLPFKFWPISLHHLVVAEKTTAQLFRRRAI